MVAIQAMLETQTKQGWRQNEPGVSDLMRQCDAVGCTDSRSTQRGSKFKLGTRRPEYMGIDLSSTGKFSWLLANPGQI